jgi:hypothetical protein
MGMVVVRGVRRAHCHKRLTVPPDLNTGDSRERAARLRTSSTSQTELSSPRSFGRGKKTTAFEQVIFDALERIEKGAGNYHEH